RSRLLRIVCGVIILVFFTFYVSSGMVAAGKFFESSFGLNYLGGMLLVAAITMVYTLFGGFLGATLRSEEHTSELQSRFDLVCRLLLEKKNNYRRYTNIRM